ncbi:MAG TPA: hypothetical protein VHO70_06425 [Chitinispirillaceae bacterium]|nr:hypothetical protein [Chitinispirillaceae bacterium]
MDKNKLAIEDFKTYLAKIPPGSSDYYDVRNAIDDLEKKGK